VLIVGGVAGGASCAARLRRLDESVEIVVFDRGPYVSFANCGLPYYVGNVIADERRLLIASRETFRDRFNVEVHTETEVTGIDRGRRTISVRDVQSGTSRIEPYDALVLSSGAAPIRPPLPGVDLPGVFAVRSIPDSRRIRSWIVDHTARTAVVVGGGFIGLEMVENLIHRELSVAVLYRRLDPLFGGLGAEHRRGRHGGPRSPRSTPMVNTSTQMATAATANRRPSCAKRFCSGVFSPWSSRSSVAILPSSVLAPIATTTPRPRP
jgi:NADPH-dependent 2,4-dienoyl-CoA reductase/sulfur reductase-like enzyme